MIWGAIGWGYKSPLVFVEGNLNARKYTDEIITPHVLPRCRLHPRSIFQQDNARPHTAQLTTRALTQGGVCVLDWPAWSPDMNPIEHVWDILGRRIKSRLDRPRNLEQLRAALTEEWAAISLNQINWLVGSMRRRVRALLVARGGHNRY